MSSFDDNEPLTGRERVWYIAGLMFSAAVIIGWLAVISIVMAHVFGYFWSLR